MLLAGAISPAKAEDRTDGADRSDVLAEVPIEKGGGPILVRVDIDPSPSESDAPRPARTVTMMLDTGAQRTIFDLAHRDALGERIDTLLSPGPAGPNEIEVFNAPAMRVGDVAMPPFGKVACMDLRWLTRGAGQQVDGLLGMEALRAMIISLDFDEGRLRFLKHRPLNCGHRVPLLWRGENGPARPYALARIGGSHAEEFLIDTGGVGFCAGGLSPRSYDRLTKESLVILVGLAGRFNRLPGVVTSDGPARAALACAPSFTLGTDSHQRLMFVRHPRSNILGLGYLSRYSVVFDFPEGAMYLRPGQGFGRREICHDLTSFVATRNDAGIVIDSLFDFDPKVSPALRTVAAEIRPGDELLAINGERAEGLSLFTIRRMLAHEPYQILDMRRAGVERRVLLDSRRDVSELHEAIDQQLVEVGDERARQR